MHSDEVQFDEMTVEAHHLGPSLNMEENEESVTRDP